MHRKSRDLMWPDTNIGEMFCLFALVILQGIVQKPSITSSHSTNPLIATPSLSSVLVEFNYFYFLNTCTLLKKNHIQSQLQNLKMS